MSIELRFSHEQDLCVHITFNKYCASQRLVIVRVSSVQAIHACGILTTGCKELNFY
jgi:hypothetical protein